MPHLSPLSWAICPLLFWFMFLLITSSIWWNMSPKYPSSSMSSAFKFSQLMWKL